MNVTATLATTLTVTLVAGLWPLGGAARDAEPTIGSLRGKPPAIEAQGDVAGSAVLARDHYREFLALSGTPADMRAGSMRRLADLYLAEGEEGEVAGDAAASERGYREATALYRQYLAEFPQRPGADAVLYSLSRAQDGLGEAEAALATLDELVRSHPQSGVAAEAHFRRGERRFVTRDYAGAGHAYAEVVARGAATEFYEQALYKLGWSRFKLGQYEECLDPFLAVLERRLAGVSSEDDRRLLDGLSKPERELVEDTLRAMSLSVSQLDGMASIDALLDRRGPVAFADVIYAGLGDLYLSQERWGDAADAYRGFVRRAATHPRAPYLQAEVIRAYTAGKFPSKVLDAKAEYVELYGLHSVYWRDVAPALRPAVVVELKASLTDLASHDHARAQKTRAPDAYQKAALWYRRYLDFFPEDPDSAQRNFLLAEILYEAGDFATATTEYRRTAYGYGAHTRAAEAGYAGLLAARRHESQLPVVGQALWHAAQTEEQLKFAAMFPDHPQAAVVQTDAAEDLFRRGELERAVQVAGEVVARMPPAAPAQERVAWTVLAHAQFDLGRYADAEQSYVRLRTYAQDDPQLRGQVEERIAAAVYKQAEAEKAAGNSAAAIAGFLRVAEAAPGSAIRPNAIFDAAALLVTDRQWSQAIGVLQRFRREFPQHEFNPEVTQQLAVALVEAGRRAEAATEFENIAATAALPADVQREALWRAAELHRKSGQHAGAARAYALIVERFPQPFGEAMEARQHLADIALDGGDAAARTRWLQEIVNVDAQAGAGRSERSRYLAAHAALELAAPLRDAFVAARLAAPLPQSLKAKQQRMELALAGYGRAADYGVAEVTTAATFETAELYVRLSRDLIGSAKPAGLGADELEEYQLLIEEQAFPFEEKAIELHGLNAARAADGVFDEWVQKSFARLAELSPARYARSERSESDAVPQPADPGDLFFAAGFIERAAEACGTCAAPWNELGVIRRRQGRFAEAEQSYLRAIAGDAGYANAWFNLGVLYEIYLQRPALALEHYESFRELHAADEAPGEVDKWIADLKRRTGAVEKTARMEDVP